MTKTTDEGLYVSRPLINVPELVAWAQAQRLPPLDDELHVTLAHSVDDFPHTPELPHLAAHPKSIELLGKDGAVVLMLQSDELEDRWADLRDAGAAWQFNGYNPHLTLFYDPEFDVADVELPDFDLMLGPEEALPLRKALLKFNANHDQKGRFAPSADGLVHVPDVSTIKQFNTWKTGLRAHLGLKEPTAAWEHEHFRALHGYFAKHDSMVLNAIMRGKKEITVLGKKVKLNGHTWKTSNLMADMIQELHKSPYTLAAGEQLYRGGMNSVVAGLKPGDEFVDKAFVSTTALRGEATRDRNQIGISKAVRIKVMTPTKVLINEHEAEFLLPPGTRFVVKKNGRTVELEAHVPEEYRG